MVANLETDLQLAREQSILVLILALVCGVTFLTIVVWTAQAVLLHEVSTSSARTLIGAISPLVGGSLFGWHLKLERYRRDLNGTC